MPLSHLIVLHRRKSAASAASVARTNAQPVFHLETCLREIWIVPASPVPAPLLQIPAVERHHGSRAYEFLLRVGCGLDSEIKGESDVFGQLRDAWREFERQHPAHAHDLGPLLQRVFEDVKEIRTSHLRALGTTTYGGLTRKLLGQDARATTLLIGGGRMAQAVLPYLAIDSLMVWNRSRGRIAGLLAGADRFADTSKVRIVGMDAASELQAWQQATNVIVCIPQDASTDRTRIAAWRSRERTRGRVIHLGLLSAGGSAWSEVAGLATLQDLFALQASHTALREAQLARAASACREKANLRSLGGPLSLAHGWEDLSLFASTG